MSVVKELVGTIHFLVNTDCTLVFEHKDKIERLFSVALFLDVPALRARYNWVGVKGDPRDRQNARLYTAAINIPDSFQVICTGLQHFYRTRRLSGILVPTELRLVLSYILSLVKAPDSIYTAEKIIYLPPEVNDDVIETVERRTTAAIIPHKDDVFQVRGNTLSVNAAMTELEEIVDKAIEPDISHSTPARPNHASRRLSCALQDTLNKTNYRGDYTNAPDAVKRAIASFLIEGNDEEQTVEDDDDVILIEDDNDDTIQHILIEDDGSEDDDVMIIETPRKTKVQTEQKNNVMSVEDLKDNRSKITKSVEDLTKAFSDMKTPSKSINKSKSQKKAKRAVVKPLNFNEAKKEEEDIVFNETASRGKETAKGKEENAAAAKVDKKKKKKKKKRTASKLNDENSFEVITISDDPPALLRKGQMYIEENKDKQSDAKRRKLKSAVVQPSILTAKQPKDCTESVQPQGQCRETKNLKLHSEADKTSTKGKKKSSGTDTIENYRKTKSLETERDNVFFNKKTFDGETSKSKDTDNDGGRGSLHKDNNTIVPCTRPVRFNDDLRYIVIDGSNVAMQHGPDNVFSCKGLRICVDFFRNRGHRMITVFLPHWRKCRPNNPASVSHRYVLDDLEKEGYLVYTPSRRIGKKLVASYDDRYVIELAEREDGIVVSNDQYRDLLHEKHSWRRVIQTRLLMFTFVRDHFMPPEDPYGRNGPTLSELLRLPRVRPAAAALSLGQDMYSRLKGLEAGNPRSDRREIEQDFYSCKASRYKCH